MAKKEVTQEQIDAWKEQFREVYIFEIDDERTGEKLKCYMRKADRKTLSAGQAVVSSNISRFNEIIVNGCWLGGDEIIKEDDYFWMALVAQMQPLVDYKMGELRKL